MDNSVQYGIRGSGIAVEDVIPVGNRKLAHDDGGVASVAVFYYFHQVKQLLSLKHLHAKVIQYEQVCLCYFGEELVQRTGYPVLDILASAISSKSFMMLKYITLYPFRHA